MRQTDKWWPKGAPQFSTDPVTGRALQQMLMPFYNQAGIWRCGNCGWNEVFSIWSLPCCKKCGKRMKLQVDTYEQK